MVSLELLDEASVLFEPFLIPGNAAALVFHKLLEPLDGGQANTDGIHVEDGLVRVAEPECPVEILGHGSHVADGGILELVVPGLDGDARQFLQDLLGIGGLYVFHEFDVCRQWDCLPEKTLCDILKDSHGFLPVVVSALLN